MRGFFGRCFNRIKGARGSNDQIKCDGQHWQTGNHDAGDDIAFTGYGKRGRIGFQFFREPALKFAARLLIAIRRQRTGLQIALKVGHLVTINRQIRTNDVAAPGTATQQRRHHKQQRNHNQYCRCDTERNHRPSSLPRRICAASSRRFWDTTSVSGN